MIYFKPNQVTSPQKFMKIVRVIFDGGLYSFSIAELEWEGSKVYGMRWNVSRKEWDDSDKISGKKICLGMPVSRARPVWFVIPNVTAKYFEQIISDELERLKSEGDRV